MYETCAKLEWISQDVNQHLKIFPILLFDVSGHLNLTFRMTRAAFLEVILFYLSLYCVHVRVAGVQFSYLLCPIVPTFLSINNSKF